MNTTTGHPEDFGPYLDRNPSDPEHEKIRIHLEQCEQCRGEIRLWQVVDDLFRGSRDEIEVPPFQWQRIAAQLESPLPSGWPVQLGQLIRPWKLAWNLALATLVCSAAILAGLQYHRSYEDKQILLAISNYAVAEEQRTSSETNPFRTATTAEHANESNPFALRR